MSYSVKSLKKTVCFYSDTSSFSPIKELELGKKRFTSTIKNSENDANCIRVVESLVKHDSYERHINNFTKIREFKRDSSGKFFLNKTTNSQNY
jgi:hypothetical protein